MVTLPGGVGYFFGIVNAAVHTLMYYYYYRSSFSKPSWGVVVTTLQLSQMVIGIVVATSWTIVFFYSGMCTCSVPYIFIFSSVGLYGSYFILFLNFYRKRYNKQSPVKKE